MGDIEATGGDTISLKKVFREMIDGVRPYNPVIDHDFWEMVDSLVEQDYQRLVNRAAGRE